MSNEPWAAVVPVKPSATAKSRLAPVLATWRRDLAVALSADTIETIGQTNVVGRVFVVTSDAAGRPDLAALGVAFVNDPANGLDINAAIGAGVGVAAATYDRIVVLTADLPALRSVELSAALEATVEVGYAVVGDADETGTTMLGATDHARLVPAFGADSFSRHQSSGAVPLRDQTWPGLRRDVDTAEQLAVASSLGLGRRTARVYQAITHAS